MNLIIICLCHRIIGTGKMSFINSSMRNILKLELKKFNLKDINFRKYQLARVTDNTEETIFTNEDHCILTVIEAVSSIASQVLKETSGQPDDPGRTVDEVHAWIRDATGVGYWQKGPLFFEIYLQKVFWDHTECNTATGLY